MCVEASTVDSLIHDIREAWRSLRRRPGFALAALLTLTIGIAANAAVFTVLDAILLRPLPFGPRSSRIVTLHSTHPTQAEDWEESGLSFADLQDVRTTSRLLEDAAGYVDRGFTLSADGETERIRGASVTPNLFAMLGAEPLLGRHFRPDEGARPGFEPVAILSHSLWQRRFASDPAIVGKPIQINQRAIEVIGVMGEGFQFPERQQFWVAFGQDRGPRESRELSTVAVLREGATLPQLQHELDAIAKSLAELHPASDRGFGLRGLTFRGSRVGSGERVAVFSLMAAVACVLLIGCANLANLLLARGIARQRELAVRAALGATRLRILRPMLLESLILASLGALLGAWLGQATLAATLAAWPEQLPYWLRFDLDLRVVAFLAGLVMTTAVAVGVFPALRMSRPDVVEALKEGERSVGSQGDQRLQSALLVGQVALCLALLVGANLLIRSFLHLQEADPGFDVSRLVSLRLNLSGDDYDPLAAKAAFFRRATEGLGEIPGVEAASATSSIPADDGGHPVWIAASTEGAAGGAETGALRIAMLPGLFDTLGTPLLEGRTFTEQETERSDATVAIVNLALARRMWPDGGALGRRIGILESNRTSWSTVVGVAPNLKYEEFGEETAHSRHQLYVPHGRTGARSMAFLVRTQGDPGALLQPVRRALFQIEPRAPVFDLQTMRERRALNTWRERFFGKAMGLFAAVALFLACLGIYGALSESVLRRTREMGVRLALGARPGDVRRLVLRRAGLLFAAGAAFGTVLAAALSRLLGGVLYGLSPADPFAFLGMAAVLCVVVLAASFLPAERAARTDPINALRRD
jgi:predicted permease